MKLRIYQKDRDEIEVEVNKVSDVESEVMKLIKLPGLNVTGIYFKTIMDYMQPGTIKPPPKPIRMYEIIATVSHAREDALRVVSNVFIGFLEEEIGQL